MSLKISVDYKGSTLIYDVEMQEENIYQLRLDGKEAGITPHEEYVPEKIVIRKKGMVWISDSENYTELIEALTNQIRHFSKTEKI
jgi:hypothetical protein